MDRNEPPDSGQLPPSELADDLSETARVLFSAGSVTDTLARVVELARATIDGCDYAGLLLLEGGLTTTPIHTDPIVDRMHALQHDLGEGPGVDAVAQGTIFYSDDVGTDVRWPRFGPQASSIGLRSALALPLGAEGNLGALNLYARFPAAFGSSTGPRG